MAKETKSRVKQKFSLNRNQVTHATQYTGPTLTEVCLSTWLLKTEIYDRVSRYGARHKCLAIASIRKLIVRDRISLIRNLKTNSLRSKKPEKQSRSNRTFQAAKFVMGYREVFAAKGKCIHQPQDDSGSHLTWIDANIQTSINLCSASHGAEELSEKSRDSFYHANAPATS